MFVCVCVCVYTNSNDVFTYQYRYPLLPHLFTPVRNPQNQAEERYNVRHKHTRCVVEQALGISKMRFRCLHRSAGCLVYKPETCVQIITACLILHNVCVEKNLPLEDDLEEFMEPHIEDNDLPDDPIMPGNPGVAAHNRLIRARFT